ncbi:uncharacterized protein EDB91DRAFT_650610 [Suillus paluster]|uniref:uncharacterized protein n=1 Tax=Suillus paluster TaxID=48578 RepID=UPI001B86CA6D|nr:uncharacterized protein EDB91DRAFT_650610 [Suillus paluster]KAG1733023.1 hypothetical protein EDB91DRAFT_650610 [Suillus paluster]
MCVSPSPLYPVYASDDPEMPFIPMFHAKLLSAKGRQPSLRMICAALAGVSLLSFGALLLEPLSYLDVQYAPAYSAVFNSRLYVQGPPTQRFRDNFRNDTKYIISWASSGWTNDVMTYGNLIYLALITERIRIIPKFLSSHIDKSELPFAFGEVIDAPRLSQAIGIPLLECKRLGKIPVHGEVPP